jgi:hypothetical protein
MRNNPVHLLAPMVREAGFDQVDGGDVQPLIGFSRAVKPTGTTSTFDPSSELDRPGQSDP